MEKSNPVRVLFLGVSTGASLVHSVFAHWADCLGKPLVLESHDLPLNANPEVYRQFVSSMRKGYPGIGGALITSHKAAIFDSAANLFNRITPLALRLGEIGMVYWRNNEMVADANDPLSTQQVGRRLLSESSSWVNGSRSAIILGGGGAGVALANTLVTDNIIGCRSIIITEVNRFRIEKLKGLIDSWNSQIPIQILQVTNTADDIVANAGLGSLIANATGMGKDRPGSPVSANVVFPERSFIWEFNYRFVKQSSPTFLEIASRQMNQNYLTIEDGWDYFIWGWLGVMSNVLGLHSIDFHDGFAAVAKSIR